MITREIIEGRIKQAQQNAAVTIGSAELIAVYTMALERLDIEPRPIEKAPRDDTVLVWVQPGPANTTFQAPEFSGWREHYIDEFGNICDTTTWKEVSKHGHWDYTHFIPLSSLPKAKNDDPR